MNVEGWSRKRPLLAVLLLVVAVERWDRMIRATTSLLGSVYSAGLALTTLLALGCVPLFRWEKANDKFQ